MKQRINALSNYFGILFNRLKAVKSWHHALRSERSMIGFFLQVPIILSGKVNKSYVLAIVKFTRFIFQQYRSTGPRGLAKYLRTCHVLLVKNVAGTPILNPMSSLGHRVSITGKGLPKIIPSPMRKEITLNNTIVIKFWLSLFSVFRILPNHGKINLKTIVKPGLEFELREFSEFVPIFFRRFSISPNIEVKPWEPVIITKGGPGTINMNSNRASVLKLANTTCALIVQSIALSKNIRLYDSFRRVCELTGQQSLVRLLDDTSRLASNVKSIVALVPPYLGKLGIKEEPMKVRVFAMVDWWSQMVLRPLHLALFDILKKIPQDATFDQGEGVRRGQLILKRTQWAASFDLSAATDRLSLKIQCLLVDYLFNGLGEDWANLLVGRDYLTPASHRKLGMKIPETVRYAVGQPMGALSSWAMLALTHHFIVQLAAQRAGYKWWFADYLVLGDDIVIFEKVVAKKYLEIMKLIGVDINLVKSVVSETTFEFAKRIMRIEDNLSPISFKEVMVASRSLEAAVLLFSRVNSGWSVASFAKFRGYKYKSLSLLTGLFSNMSTHLRYLVAFATIPGLSKWSFSRWVDWFGADKVGGITSDTQFSSIWDRFQVLYKSTEPYGYDPSGGSSYQGYFQSAKTSLWYDIGLDILGEGGECIDPNSQKPKKIPYNYSAVQLTWLLHGVFYPLKAVFQTKHRLLDSMRSQTVDVLLPSTKSLDDMETFIKAYLEYERESSFTPKEKKIDVYRLDEPPQLKAGRWLKWWSSTHKVH